MRLLTPLLACLLLVLSSWTGTAHASGMSGCDEPARTEMVSHFEGDCDQVPADADKGYPHHHGACHGCQAAVPAEMIAETPIEHTVALLAIARIDGLTPAKVDAALRPPQA